MACIKKFTKDILKSCVEPDGVIKDRLILINVEDIDFANVTTTTTYASGTLGATEIITSLPLKSGARGYEIEGINGSIIARETAERGTYRPAITQEIEFVAWSVEPDTLDAIQQLLKSKVIAVFESNGQFRVGGWKSGMQVRSLSADTSDTDKGGMFTIILDKVSAPSLMPVFGVLENTTNEYDYAASLAAFENLKQTAP
jgi:hypothetical protein